MRGLLTFEVLTDHRPLVGVFRKQLSLLENARLMRMKEKIQEFTFKVKWVQGKMQYIADTLSRSPVLTPKEEELTIHCAIMHCRQISEARTMNATKELQHEDYKKFISAVLEFSKNNCTRQGSHNNNARTTQSSLGGREELQNSLAIILLAGHEKLDQTNNQ